MEIMFSWVHSFIIHNGINKDKNTEENTEVLNMTEYQ